MTWQRFADEQLTQPTHWGRLLQWPAMALGKPMMLIVASSEEDDILEGRTLVSSPVLEVYQMGQATPQIHG